jgi:malonate transporter MadM subunit
MEVVVNYLEKNSLILCFLLVGLLMYCSDFISKKIINKKVPGSAIAILLGLVFAYIGGIVTDGKNGLSDIKTLSGFQLLGGNMFRDLAIVSTAFGASFTIIKKTGWIGVLSLIVGIIVSFSFGAIVAMAWGYNDAKSLATIGAGACTFIVGPVTGNAIGASQEVITLSLAAGVVKTIATTIATPMVARYIGLDNPHTAMVYGGIIGTTSGVTAGLAATDPKLVPYGALTATFYTGLGCLLCPSIFYFILDYLLAL